MERIILALLLLSCFRPIHSQGIVFFLDPDELSNKVQEIMDRVLKASEIQKHFDSFSFLKSKNDLGEKEINKMIQTISDRIDNQTRAINNLQLAVVSAYSAATKLNDSTNCCNVKNTKYSFKHNTKVNEESACHVPYRFLQSGYLSPSVEKISDACKENAKNYPATLWQSFKSEVPFSTVYPSLKLTTCDIGSRGYYRSAFAQGYTPKRTIMVIVIDISSAAEAILQDTESSILTEVVFSTKETLSTLDSFDEFAIVAFSEDVKVLGGPGSSENCFNRTLVQATPQNKRIINRLLDQLEEPAGRGRRKAARDRNYTAALERGFDFFHHDYYQDSDDKLNRIMLFVAAGEPKDSRVAVLQTLRNENLKINDSVIIFTYGIGNADFSVLQDIANLNANQAETGRYAAIPNAITLSNEMPYYYRYLPASNFSEPIWSPPLEESSGKNLLTGSLPVYVNSTRVGVVEATIALGDLLIETQIFRPNVFSYSFVIDREGLLLYHPFHPVGVQGRLVNVDARIVEQESEFLSIYELLKRGESGNKTFLSSQFVRTGTNQAGSVENVRILKKYIWKSIPKLRLSLCLVLSQNNTNGRVILNESIPPGTFLHHRMDVVPPKNPCFHHVANRPIGSRDQSSVQLSFRAFENPADFIFHNLTREDVLSIGKYMEGSGPNKFNIKKEAKQDVVLTFHAEELWKKEEDDNELRKHVIRRMIGTENGVFRIFRATPVPKFFDAVFRPWYVAAQVYPNMNVITLPFLSAGARASTLSICKTIHRKTTSGSHSETIGVMSASLLVKSFSTLVRDVYSYWITSQVYKLYVSDGDGYLIVAEEYDTDNNILHLTAVEPQISSVLIQNHIMQRVNCSRYDFKTLQRQYSVKFPSNQTAFRGIIRVEEEKCYGFSFFSVQGTNLFILIRTIFHIGCESVYKEHAKNCICANNSSKTCLTNWENISSCECPCTTINPNYRSCSNTYSLENISIPPCAVVPPLSRYTDGVGLYNVTDLPECFEVIVESETGASYSTIVLSASLSALILLVLVTAGALFLLNRHYMAKTRPETDDSSYTLYEGEDERNKRNPLHVRFSESKT